MNNYATSVACWSGVSSKDIFTIDRDEESGYSTYFVLWSGNKNCDAGIASQSFYVSEVSKISNRAFTVKSDDAFGGNSEEFWTQEKITVPYINYRFIESIKQIKPDSFEIIAWNYADDKFGGTDSGNNPANKFNYTLQLTESEGWKITNQTLLEQNK